MTKLSPALKLIECSNRNIPSAQDGPFSQKFQKEADMKWLSVNKTSTVAHYKYCKYSYKRQRPSN